MVTVAWGRCGAEVIVVTVAFGLVSLVSNTCLILVRHLLVHAVRSDQQSTQPSVMGLRGQC